MNNLIIDTKYQTFLRELKLKISRSRIRAALAVNQELIRMYWDLGKKIIEMQKQHSWGSKFLEQLSQDLRNAFPESHSSSTDKLKRMRMLAEKYSDGEFRAQDAPQLPWGHIILLMQKLKIKNRENGMLNNV